MFTYIVGDKGFCQESGEAVERFEKKDALKCAVEYFGEEFMAEHDLDKMDLFKILYMKGDKISGFEFITEEEFYGIKEEIQVLTTMISLGKQIYKETVKR